MAKPGLRRYRRQFADQVPAIIKQFLHHTNYAKATCDDIFKGRPKDSVTENLGGDQFRRHILPQEAQFAPVNAIICDDLDGDGFMYTVLGLIKGAKGQKMEVIAVNNDSLKVMGINSMK